MGHLVLVEVLKGRKYFESTLESYLEIHLESHLEIHLEVIQKVM